MNMDILLETACILLVAVIIGRFLATFRVQPVRTHPGWKLIFSGTCLVFIALVFDLSDNFDSLNHFIILGDTVAESIIEKTSYLFGYLCMALGFFKWLPSITLLSQSQKLIEDQHQSLETILDSIDEIIYVADMASHEVVFVNKRAKQIFGDITGKICWQSLQTNQSGPCDFCTNKYLLTAEGKPAEIHTWEFQNTLTGQWFHIKDRAIDWIDGRKLRMEIAFDISERKKTEQEKEALLTKLQDSLKKVKLLSGFLPICASCKKIRDDSGYWNQIESYIRKNSDAEFSHSICPDCAKQQYPEEYEALYGETK